MVAQLGKGRISKRELKGALVERKKVNVETNGKGKGVYRLKLL